ncbi:hypothetical protein J6590_041139 [Homalodisca vitripennis]|nr:hypothetical protein J6590_041139 [Homalodisca vitripennis]
MGFFASSFCSLAQPYTLSISVQSFFQASLLAVRTFRLYSARASWKVSQVPQVLAFLNKALTLFLNEASSELHQATLDLCLLMTGQLRSKEPTVAEREGSSDTCLPRIRPAMPSDIMVISITSLRVLVRNVGTFAIIRLRDIMYSRSNLPLLCELASHPTTSSDPLLPTWSTNAGSSLEGVESTSSYGRYDDATNRAHPVPATISLTVARSLQQNSRTGMLSTLLLTTIHALAFSTWALPIFTPVIESPDIFPLQIQGSCIRAT